jgi:hypothetical protein
MSHDRGCACGLEPYEYIDCKDLSCMRRQRAIEARVSRQGSNFSDIVSPPVQRDVLKIEKGPKGETERQMGMLQAFTLLALNRCEPASALQHIGVDASEKRFQSRLGTSWEWFKFIYGCSPHEYITKYKRVGDPEFDVF